MGSNEAPTQPKTPGCIFQTKEYWLIIYLIALDFKIMNVECLQDQKGQDYLLWTFPPEAVDVEHQYNHNEEMTVDLQKIRTAADVFKRNLQYFRIR